MNQIRQRGEKSKHELDFGNCKVINTLAARWLV